MTGQSDTAGDRTVPDCALDGESIPLSRIPHLSSEEMARIVGTQCPGDMDEKGSDFDWTFEYVPLEDLRFSNQHGEEPEGGWVGAYHRHKASDEEAGGAYLGRQEWLAEWAQNTETYPIYVERHEDGYRILDGHHRLAGAFFNRVPAVAAFVGVYRPDLAPEI